MATSSSNSILNISPFNKRTTLIPSHINHKNYNNYNNNKNHNHNHKNEYYGS
jgi:hypothetical protein